jgi:hypothetical protein
VCSVFLIFEKFARHGRRISRGRNLSGREAGRCFGVGRIEWLEARFGSGGGEK